MSNGNEMSECQYLADEISRLREYREQLRTSLETATDAGEINWILSEIRRVNTEIRGLQGAYGRCMARGDPAPLLIIASFVGTYTLRTASESIGTRSGSLTLGLTFHTGRSFLTVSVFPPITTEEYEVGAGVTATTTVTMVGTATGIFDPRRTDLNYGSILLPIVLNFDTELTPFLPVPVDMTATFRLSTSPPPSEGLGPVAGSRLDQTGPGQVAVGGSARFEGGLFSGTECVLELSGTISPDPGLP
jgi:hypothetical protein